MKASSAANKYLIIIAGPTAVGKTAVAITIAKHFQTEIVSADSRQVFKELNIGVARPSEEELNSVPHHFIAHKSVHDYYSAGEYERECIALLDNLFKTKDVVVMCGGTGLYIQAVCNGFDAIPEIDPHIRETLNKEFIEHGIIPLQEKLKTLDPETFEKIDIQNTQRVIRALEVCMGAGVPFSSFHKGKKETRNFIPVKIGLSLEKEELYDRINHRVDQMIENGLIEEARNVYPFKENTALQTVGYKELFDHFEEKLALDEAIGKIKQHTRNYAKRQLTWFKKDTGFRWFSPNDLTKIIQFINAQIGS
jgi:tRNA dimethylallyltransferase